jgi:hypothetical protein
MAYNNLVDTITLEEIIPRVVDTVLRGNRFTTKMLSKTKRFGAATQDFPIKYQVGTAIQSFLGYDTLPTSFTDTRVLMKFNPRFVTANIALAGTDLMANNTAAKVIDLMSAEMQSRAQDLADGIGTQLWSDGTGNSNKDFLGLAALVDDGTTVSTIGGLSRSTYTTLKSTVTSASTLSLSTMRTLWNAISDHTVAPSRVYTDYASWALFEQLLVPQEKIYKEINFAPNYKMFEGVKEDGLAYAGMEVVPDRKATSGQMVFLNEDYINFYALEGDLPVYEDARKVDVAGKLFTGNSYNEVKNLGFYWTGFIKTNNQFAYNSFVISAGNLLTDNPRRHGKLTGITTI